MTTLTLLTPLFTFYSLKHSGIFLWDIFQGGKRQEGLSETYHNNRGLQPQTEANEQTEAELRENKIWIRFQNWVTVAEEQRLQSLYTVGVQLSHKIWHKHMFTRKGGQWSGKGNDTVV